MERVERIRRKLSTKTPGTMKESGQVKQSEAERPAATVTESERNVKTRMRRVQTMRESGARRANSIRIRENKPVREEDFIN